MNILKKITFLHGLFLYYRDLRILKKQEGSSIMRFPFGTPYRCLEDRFSKSGNASGHYFHQDLLVARRIFVNGPLVHVDIGSRVDGFVAHVASFRKITVVDIRTLGSNIPNVDFIQADVSGDIEAGLVDYCDSLSCLHALEHFGLGRYGDPVQYDGYLTGLENIHRILRRQGKLYISVPIGPLRIEFNAHRIFSIEYLLKLFNGRYRLDYFSYVDGRGDLHENAEMTENDITENFGCNYGCGIFEMTKL